MNLALVLEVISVVDLLNETAVLDAKEDEDLGGAEDELLFAKRDDIPFSSRSRCRLQTEATSQECMRLAG